HRAAGRVLGRLRAPRTRGQRRQHPPAAAVAARRRAAAAGLAALSPLAGARRALRPAIPRGGGQAAGPAAAGRLSLRPATHPGADHATFPALAARPAPPSRTAADLAVRQPRGQRAPPPAAAGDALLPARAR